MKRLACFVLCLALVLSVTACGKQYSEFYRNSPDAASLMEDAIELLDMCINKEITAEECADQLQTIGELNQGGDDIIISSTALGISIAGDQIHAHLLLLRLGSETMIDVNNAVKEQREYLYNKLYGE
jgi:hypothetical protein